MRKGILLAGGGNSRLYPSTRAVAKSLLAIYDKPLVYYPLATLMQAGVRDILIVTAPPRQEAHRQLLGDGGRFGVSLSYAVQPQPRGIADAFLIGRDFIAGSPSMLVLCDNIFHGRDFPALLQQAARQESGATVFARQVPDPQRFGVVEFDSQGKALSLEEKPPQPASSYAVTGCYLYDARACDHAAALQPSSRGELEITDLNRRYLEDGALSVQKMANDTAWFDAGTPDSMAAAAAYVQSAQKEHGAVIACPEEIGWRQGWLERADLLAQAERHPATAYGEHLRRLAESA